MSNPFLGASQQPLAITCYNCDTLIRVYPSDIKLVNLFSLEDGGRVMCNNCNDAEILVPYVELRLSLWPKFREAEVKANCQTQVTKCILKKEIYHGVTAKPTSAPGPLGTPPSVMQNQECTTTTSTTILNLGAMQHGRDLSPPPSESHTNKNSRPKILRKR